MAKILVTGANGQLGSELRDIAGSFRHHIFLFEDRTGIDITNDQDITSYFSIHAPQYCINCAAYTAVDKAETEEEQALAVNVQAVKNLAAACNQYGAKFIHISTDYVFDGTANKPYKEEDAPHPVNRYGQSKLMGEIEAQKESNQTIILRTSWVYSVYGNNFVKTMLRLMQSRPQINVVADQQGSPTYAADLAAAIMHIIDSGVWVPGIYHFTNEGETTWFQFAEAIKELYSLNCTIQPIKTEQYPTPAKRPKYSVLDKEKIVRTFQIRLIPWQQSLSTCLLRLKKQKQNT
ncbi:MAG: dTDP-4-dehydrorhamnose reductase [Flavisolibacter sp.]|nr:dTDP-4-dehydrorhamnose reductase [Flavisolibacter sp.]